MNNLQRCLHRILTGRSKNHSVIFKLTAIFGFWFKRQAVLQRGKKHVVKKKKIIILQGSIDQKKLHRLLGNAMSHLLWASQTC